MTGRPLNSVRSVPPALLRHLGRELDISTPDLVSLRALYARGRTLFDHQQQACECLGFQWMTEHQRRALVRVLRDEVVHCADRERLLVLARQWLYDHRLLIVHDRVIRAMVAAALDQYAGYDTAMDARVYPKRVAAGCVVHARRKYDEVAKAGTSPVAEAAIKRLAQIYHLEGSLAAMPAEHRHNARQELTKPLWVEFKLWLELERRRVPDGSSIAAAIDYSLNHWAQLTRHLDDGDVPLDNNFLERQIKPWQMGRKKWLFAGSALAGQRAAVVMSLVQSAKLHGHDPWQYLRDVLARLPTHLNSRIEELLPHRWRVRALSEPTST